MLGGANNIYDEGDAFESFAVGSSQTLWFLVFRQSEADQVIQSTMSSHATEALYTRKAMCALGGYQRATDISVRLAYIGFQLYSDRHPDCLVIQLQIAGCEQYRVEPDAGMLGSDSFPTTWSYFFVSGWTSCLILYCM